jgi:hypothetical protein
VACLFAWLRNSFAMPPSPRFSHTCFHNWVEAYIKSRHTVLERFKAEINAPLRISTWAPLPTFRSGLFTFSGPGYLSACRDRAWPASATIHCMYHPGATAPHPGNLLILKILIQTFVSGICPRCTSGMMKIILCFAVHETL